jgi:hypothetical protein
LTRAGKAPAAAEGGGPEAGTALPRTVVYACTELGYDQIFSPVAPTPGVEFLLFADRRPRFVRGWRWRPLPEAARGLSPTLANRYAKFFPHRVLPEAGVAAEISVYLDANTLILADLTPLIAEFAASGADIGLFRHRERASPEEELAFGRAVGKIPEADAGRGAAQLARYRAEGLPADAPFTENAIIFRRHGRPGLEAAMDLWWAELEAYTRRDQLSLPYVLFRSRLAVKLWDWNYKYENPYFLRYLHRRGPLSDLNVFLKNKRHYGPAQDRICGALLFLAHGGRGYRSQHRRRSDSGRAESLEG